MTNEDIFEKYFSYLRQWNTPQDFLSEYESILTQISTDNVLRKEFRLGRGKTKRIRDEVLPLKRFLKELNDNEAKIKLLLDSGESDAIIRLANGNERSVQITIANGQEKYHIMKELNETGRASGLLGLMDGSPRSDFIRRVKKGTMAWSYRNAIKHALKAIRLCVRKKNQTKYTVPDILIIDLDIQILPKDCWLKNMDRFCRTAAISVFNEVYMTGACGKEGDVCWKIK